MGQDHRRLILNDRGTGIGKPHRIHGYEWVGEGSGARLREVWKHQSPWAAVHFSPLQSWMRVGASGSREVVFVSQGGIQILDADRGEPLFSYAMPLTRTISEANLSGAGRYLLLKDGAAKELAVWDLELRREIARVEKFGELWNTAMSDDGNLLLMSDPGRLILLRPRERGFE